MSAKAWLFGLLLSGCVVAKTSVRSTSVDVGVQHSGESTPYTGVTVPLGPVNFSGGAWTTLDGTVGPYFALGWSWYPFDILFMDVHTPDSGKK